MDAMSGLKEMMIAAGCGLLFLGLLVGAIAAFGIWSFAH